MIDLPTLSFRLTGTSPLLMHNERLANPMSAESRRLRALTGKRKKTDEDVVEISRAEFDGGLYIDDNGPYIPDHWITAMLRDGGKTMKLGKAVTQGVLILDNGFPLQTRLTNGKCITADDLWNAGCFDQRMVKNQTSRILRTRPRFDEWSVKCRVNYDPSVFDERQLKQILQVAGVKIGLGDYRPKFGRFEIE